VFTTATGMGLNLAIHDATQAMRILSERIDYSLG